MVMIFFANCYDLTFSFKEAAPTLILDTVYEVLALRFWN